MRGSVRRVYKFKILIIFLLSSLFIASRKSFFFLPVKSKFSNMSYIGIPVLPRLEASLWRRSTINLSSFPQRQVVFRISTTIALPNFFFLLKFGSHHISCKFYAFRFTLKGFTPQGFSQVVFRGRFYSSSLVFQLFYIQAFDKVLMLLDYPPLLQAGIFPPLSL